MRISYVHVLQAPREKVYAALVDPEALKACIEGCESLTPAGPDAFEAVLRAGIGAVRGRVQIQDRMPPASLTLNVEGKGGPGFVRSTARLRLTEKDGATEVAGEGEAAVGGLIAALGPRLIEAAARKLLADFFAKLAARL